jgi:hypothetical protein
MGILYEHNIADFIIVTLFLGGGGAYQTGRAVALSWEPFARALLWMIPLACAVRFIHFAIFKGTLLSPWFYIVDLVVLLIFAALGHRLTRARQTAERYAWRVAADGAWSWRLKSGES